MRRVKLEKMSNENLIAILKEMHEAAEGNEIAAEAAADILWEYTELAEFMQRLQQQSADAFLILLLMILTCTNCISNFIHSNKEARADKGQIYTSRSNNSTSYKIYS